MVVLDINIDALPSLPISQRSQLPAVTAVYFAIDKVGQVQYIGRTANLRRRWYRHHVLSHLVEGRIAWEAVEEIELLSELEKLRAYKFQPPLNRQTVYRCWKGELSWQQPKYVAERVSEGAYNYWAKKKHAHLDTLHTVNTKEKQ